MKRGLKLGNASTKRSYCTFINPAAALWITRRIRRNTTPGYIVFDIIRNTWTFSRT